MDTRTRGLRSVIIWDFFSKKNNRPKTASTGCNNILLPSWGFFPFFFAYFVCTNFIPFFFVTFLLIFFPRFFPLLSRLSKSRGDIIEGGLLQDTGSLPWQTWHWWCESSLGWVPTAAWAGLPVATAEIRAFCRKPLRVSRPAFPGTSPASPPLQEVGLHL